ncbi:helix-turn-helix transcriptional regulator [Rubrivivax albus]|nr:AlpA family phage regulatory protein [Rubrivivax albus]
MTNATNIPAQGWIREGDLLATKAIPYRRTKLREEVAAGRFPKPRTFGPRMVAYDCTQIHDWIREQSKTAPVADIKPPKSRTSAQAAHAPAAA